MTRLEELRAKYGDGETPTDEQVRLARAALSLKSAIEALGPMWQCIVDARRDPSVITVHVRVNDLVGAWDLDAFGCDLYRLKRLVLEIARCNGEGAEAERRGLHALYDVFAKWKPEYASTLFPPPDRRPLPLP